MPFIGLHIHKTAGTSVLRYLERHAPSRLYGAYALRNFRLLELPLWASANLTSRDIFWGHAIYESFFYDVAEPVRLFTFLRDPTERIISWYSMLKRRKKLKKSAISLEAFATAHSNSMCRMLVMRFPSLVEDESALLSDQAMAVLEKMGFVGFQCHYSDHFTQLLEWMRVPICTQTLGARHNTAKKSSALDWEDQALLQRLNDQDHRLYALAYERYGAQPLHPERQLLMDSLISMANVDRAAIRQKQLKSAQKKFVSSLRFSLGDVGMESYVCRLNASFGACERVLDKALKRSYNIIEASVEDDKSGSDD